MGYIRSKGDPVVPVQTFQWVGYFTWMLPAQYAKLVAADDVMTRLEYDPFIVIDKHNADRVNVK